jgi:beta-lactamase regulating signal transducer with metallopeptidase domain
MLIWLYSFLVQSTLFLGAAWLLLKLVPKFSLRSREIAWNTALLASLVGPTLHVMWPNALPTPWQMPESLAMETPVDAPPKVIASKLPKHLRGRSDSINSLLHAGNLPPMPATLAITPVVESPNLIAVPVAQPFWMIVVTRLWVIGACFCLLAFAWRYQRLRRLLSDRQPVLDGQVRLMLDRLRLAAKLPRPIRLTMSNHLGSPVAIGVGRNAEVCLPSRALVSMPSEQVHAMLGHEVAHHMRRDPMHLIALNFVQALFFFQPMLRVARVELHHIAEQQCDAWGAHQAGDRWSMARCLAEVASWLLPADATHLAPGMARRRSQLTTRVRSLMDENHDASAITEQMRGRKQLVVAAAALVAAPFLAPQVIGSPLPSETDATAAAATEAESSENEKEGGAFVVDSAPSQEPDQPVATPPASELRPESEAAAFLEIWDYNIQAIRREIDGIRADLGPFAEQEPYRSTIEQADLHLQSLMRMRSVLEHLFILLSSEEGPSSDEAANSPQQTSN